MHPSSTTRCYLSNYWISCSTARHYPPQRDFELDGSPPDLWSYSKRLKEELIIIKINVQKKKATFDGRISVLSWDHLLLVDVTAVVIVEAVLLTEIGFVPTIVVVVLLITSLVEASPLLTIHHHILILEHLFLEHLLIHHWTGFNYWKKLEKRNFMLYWFYCWYWFPIMFIWFGSIICC